MKILHCLAIFLSFAFVGTAQNIDSTQWVTHSDSVGTISYPGNWELDLSGAYGSHLFLFSPMESIDDSFRENINLISRYLGENVDISLAEIAEAGKQEVMKMITDVQIIQFEEVHQGKLALVLAEYTGRQGELKAHWKQHFFLSSDSFYVLTFTADIAKYSAYLPIADRVFASFLQK